MFTQINFVEIFGAFIVMAAIIDIFGSIPIFMGMKQQNKTIKAGQACLTALGLFLAFFFAGDALLKLFGIDVASFAVAGSILLFLMALEMLLDIEIFKYNGPTNEATFIPLVFPLLAGAGALTTIIALKSEYADVNILVGLLLNMVWVNVVLVMTEKIQKRLGKAFIYMLRKFFGVMLLAIAVGMFTSNLASLIKG